ncbi:hypothetical protein [Roseisolibacter agri]|uniref:N-acetyltransferase domain-containing protein n=1 Tax=Roseisolibacter agri TaxID=2014610 RepID=A0AA37Q227_9BACT|nr:hypothetical protein [Roseisolibacter agri]GLC24954.1 hypothetical protein rosag_14670 [Roseisolibacter agri]
MSADDIDVRPLRTADDYAACVALQMATWGEGFREAVPATILRIAQRLGGVATGAFAADGTLLGFVFGMTGVEDGDVVHWSDMLAVRDALRNHGIGRRLKLHQRDAVRAAGATRMYWTYDPMLARNAHFNLTRLGARVVEFVPDMYGTDTGSALHGDSGTDRFIVVWSLAERGESPTSPRAAEVAHDAPILNDGAADGRDAEPARHAHGMPPRVRVEIPSDILAVQDAAPARAAHWRATGRHALQWALAHGYAVERFVHDAAAGRGFYLLARA